MSIELERGEPMKFRHIALSGIFGLLLTCPVGAEDERHFLSAVPTRPASVAAVPGSQSPAARPPSSPPETAAPGASSENGLPETPPPPSLYSGALDQALQQYKTGAGELAFTHVLETLKPLLTQPGAMRFSPAVLVKDNPGLGDLKPKVLEASGARVWTFPRVPERHQVILQWVETRQQVVQVGRKKRVDTKAFLHAQNLSLPVSVTVKEAGFMTLKDEARALVLSGDGGNGSLWLSAWRPQEGSWRDVPGFFDALPSFLTKNVSGQVSFKGSDLIFNIARMVDSVDGSGNHILLPEAESATYKFWVKATDGGFVLVASIPDVDAFSTVGQFMTAVQQGRADSARGMLSDPRLSAIPKYLGLSGRPIDSTARVVQMVVPPARGQRFRLTGIGKDDLIFDVGKVKGVGQIKAIFIAPPDPFLLDTAKFFPLYSKVLESSDKEPPAPPNGADNGFDSGRRSTRLRSGNKLGAVGNSL